MGDGSISRVDVDSLTKSFGKQEVLRRVSFRIGRGEVVALAGSNGAGKSTTVKLLSGIHPADSGSIRLDGVTVDIDSPDQARMAGIGVVHQDPGLLMDMTVLENFALRRAFDNRRGVIDWDRERTAFNDAVAIFEEAIDPAVLAEALPVHLRQVVAIVSELAKQVRLLILDEVTALLSDSEVHQLFRVLRRLSASDVAILLITHRMGEVFELAERVVVLRDGVVAAEGLTSSFTEESLAEAITGKRLQEHSYTSHARSSSAGKVADAEPALELDRLRPAGMRGRLTTTIFSGECVGLAGLADGGQSELLSSIFGLEKRSGGTLRVLGEDEPPQHPRAAVASGIGYLAKDRSSGSVIADLTLGENISLPWVAHRFLRRKSGAINRSLEKRSVSDVIDMLSVKCQGFDDTITVLSGGNQQKAILARWLLRPMKLLLLDEPTHGVDIATKAEVYNLIRRFVAEGGSVLVASSEFEEFTHMCDRILVLRNGNLVAEFPGNADVESLYVAAYGTQTARLSVPMSGKTHE